MNWKGTLAVLALVGGLWAFWHFYEVKGGEKRSQATEDEKKVFQNLDSAKVEEMTLQPEGAPQVHMKKQNDTWTLDEPVVWKGDSVQADSVTQQLKDLKKEETVAENPQPAELKEFGLEDPKVWISFKALSSSAQTLFFGSKTFNDQYAYARVSGNPTVFLVSAYLKTSLVKKADDLRDKTVLRFDIPSVTQVRVQTKDLKITLKKDKGNWQVEGSSDRANQDKANSLVSQLSTLRIKDFVDEDGKQAGKYGLSHASQRIELWQSGSSNPLVLEVGSEKDNSIYCHVGGQKLIFSLDKYTLGGLGKKDDFIDKSAFAIKPYEINRFTVVDAQGNSRTYIKKDGNWTRQPALAEAKDSKDKEKPDYQSFLNTLGSAKYEAKEQTSELKQPDLRLNFYDAADKQVEEIQFGAKGKKAGTRQAYSFSFKQVVDVPDSVAQSVPK